MILNSDDQTQWRHEYDQRQYRRMIERLESFEAGHLHLGGLVGDLGALLTALEEKPPNSWAHEFSVLHLELDMMNSLATYDAATSFSRKPALTNAEMRRALEIAASLKRLVGPKIDASADG